MYALKLHTPKTCIMTWRPKSLSFASLFSIVVVAGGIGTVTGLYQTKQFNTDLFDLTVSSGDYRQVIDKCFQLQSQLVAEFRPPKVAHNENFCCRSRLGGSEFAVGCVVIYGSKKDVQHVRQS